MPDIFRLNFPQEIELLRKAFLLIEEVALFNRARDERRLPRQN